MSKHTPGPWTRGFGNYVYEGNHPSEQGPLIATCYPLNGTMEELEVAFANAALIAAAPELLAALQKAVTALNAVPSFKIPSLDTTSYKLLPELERAISEAEGNP